MAVRETSGEIEAVAAEWAARVDNGPLDPPDQALLESWLAGDARRLGAYARAQAAFIHARRAKALGAGFDPDAYLATHGVTAETVDAEFPETLAQAVARGEAEPTRAAGLRRRTFLIGGGAVAASVAAALGLGWQAAAQTYSTARGEIRLVPLEDGSTITLNTASTARVTFSRRQRLVELVEGEALFDVAEDAERPFVVSASPARVRAIGTSFTVSRLHRQPVQVLVAQGVVEVERPGSAKRASRVTANARAVLAGSAPIKVTPLAATDIARALAWREGMLLFEDAPLHRAASEFARYSDMHILFADESVGQETVTGLFAANNPAGFAKAVALGLDLRVRRDRAGIVLERPE